jgi:hypothetical protein
MSTTARHKDLNDLKKYMVVLSKTKLRMRPDESRFLAMRVCWGFMDNGVLKPCGCLGAIALTS